jgi:drug/metabolite transporter (DMT)-like permease
MTLGVTALVLLSALMHATWNALIKTSRDTRVGTALLVAFASLLSAPLLVFVPAPESASWGYLVASWLVHQAYFAVVGLAYRDGDLSLTYPLMRGLPPLLVALAGALLLPDPTSPWLWSGVVCVSAGVLWIAGLRRMLRRLHPRSSTFALVNAVLIAAYTLIDGMGARASGNAASYGLWLFFLTALPYVVIVLAPHRGTIGAHLRQGWWRALLGAALSLGAYLIVLSAMTQAPVAAVAAVRETSVIFGALIGALLLKEPFGADRIAGACVVALGIALLEL